MKTIKEDLVDIAELLSTGPVRTDRMYEQEVYFDAGYTPPQTEWKIVKKEVIEGKTYYVYS
jgi:hypothetical protein